MQFSGGTGKIIEKAIQAYPQGAFPQSLVLVSLTDLTSHLLHLLIQEIFEKILAKPSKFSYHLS